MKRGYWLLVGVVVLALVVGGGLFSIIGMQDDAFTCVFTGPGSTCEYNITLNSERAMSLYTLEFDFAPVQGTELMGTTNIVPIDTHTNDETRWSGGGSTTYYNWYLFKTPSSWEDDIYSVYVEMSGSVTVSCLQSISRVRSRARFAGVTQAYPYDEFRICNRDQCREDNTDYLIRQYFDSSYGANIVRAENQNYVIGPSRNTARCYMGSGMPSVTDVVDYSYEGIVPNSNMFGGDTRFVAVVDHRIDHPVSRGRGSNTVPVVEASYYRALFPSDVSYAVADFPVETLAGRQREPYTTLDISQQVNLACNRGISVETCVVPLVITSQEAGVMTIREGEQILRVASESALADELNLAQLTLEEQRAVIAAMDASIAEKAVLIEQLAQTREEQVAFIQALEVSIEEQGLLVNELEFTLQEKIAYAQGLEASIEEQAQIINSLASNLDEKASLVASLQVENAEQAALIAAMEESFANQGGIIIRLNNTVVDDANLINALTSELSEQGLIIKGMETTLERESEIIASLTAELDSQAVIISNMRVSLDHERKLVSRLRANLDEQEALIDLLRRERQGQRTVMFFLVVLSVAAVASALFLARGKGRRRKRWW